MPDNFGEILKNIREENALTQLRFAQILGIPHSSLNKIENGKVKRVNLDMLCKICHIFNINANQLLGIEAKENLIPKKAKELKDRLNYVEEELKKLELQDKNVFEIRNVINDFVLDTNWVDGRVRIHCEGGIIPLEGLFEETEMLYALVLMSFFSKLYYKCRKVVTKIKEEECCVRIEALLCYVGMTLREQVIYDVRPLKEFQTEQFYNEFKELIETAINSLRHLTEVKYYDYITKTYRIVSIYNNTVELQYMIMNLYAKAYAESVLWLKKEEPSEQRYYLTLWLILTKMKVLVPKYFIY